jgi:hypothetical protein
MAAKRCHVVIQIESASQLQGKEAQIVMTRPSCRHCGAAMRLREIHPHPRFLNVEIVSFQCRCGALERRAVPHTEQ